MRVLAYTGSLLAAGWPNPRSRSSPATSLAWPPWPLALSTLILVSASLAGTTLTIEDCDTSSPSFGWFGSVGAGGGLQVIAWWISAGWFATTSQAISVATASTANRTAAGT